MDEECAGCGGCEECGFPLQPMRFSIFNVLTLTFVTMAEIFSALSSWWEGLADQFGRMHNRKLDMDKKRDVAEDVMATIHQLPTKE